MACGAYLGGVKRQSMAGQKATFFDMWNPVWSEPGFPVLCCSCGVENLIWRRTFHGITYAVCHWYILCCATHSWLCWEFWTTKCKVTSSLSIRNNFVETCLFIFFRFLGRRGIVSFFKCAGWSDCFHICIRELSCSSIGYDNVACIHVGHSTLFSNWLRQRRLCRFEWTSYSSSVSLLFQSPRTQLRQHFEYYSTHPLITPSPPPANSHITLQQRECGTYNLPKYTWQ